MYSFLSHRPLLSTERAAVRFVCVNLWISPALITLPDKFSDNRGQLSRLFQLRRMTAFVDHFQLRAPDRVAVRLAMGERNEPVLLAPNHQRRRLHAAQTMN